MFCVLVLLIKRISTGNALVRAKKYVSTVCIDLSQLFLLLSGVMHDSADLCCIHKRTFNMHTVEHTHMHIDSCTYTNKNFQYSTKIIADITNYRMQTFMTLCKQYYYRSPQDIHSDAALYKKHIIFTVETKHVCCSLAIVVPTYAEFFVEGTDPIPVKEGAALLEPDLAKILVAPW